MERLRVAILGCTGLVGQQFVRLLTDHPFFEIAILTSSARSAGKRYAEATQWLVPGEMPPAAAALTIRENSMPALADSGVTAVFSALPAQVAGRLEEQLRGDGYAVFSNASSHRLDADVPILIPEVNAEHLQLVELQRRRERGFIVTCSNCSASGLVMALKPLARFGIRSVTVSTYQAISGAGRRGLSALDIMGNAVPFIANEEEKVAQETRKMLGALAGERINAADLLCHVNCCRVPVRDGHLESVVLELADEVAEQEILDTLACFRGLPQELALPSAPLVPIIVRQENDRPQPVLDVFAGAPLRAQGMAVTVGRIRVAGRFLRLFLLVHNTVRGAAGTCVLNAELAWHKRLIG